MIMSLVLMTCLQHYAQKSNWYLCLAKPVFNFANGQVIPALHKDTDLADYGLAHQKSHQVDDHVKVLEIKWNPNTDAF
ncbi:hypothetical protein RF55_12329 [Lasius niger]|uniref:Uncharacterized protein n=1 Tax=Lasius niger TaxID=67767 RepID=A0A0J7N6A1_LASNI|nr:hypothetical protein RF55_12329 [Lasius niger]